MDRGLYVAAGGMLAEMDRQNNLSNNLANLSTPGYKSDYTTQRDFASLLWNNRSTGSQIGTWSAGPVTQSQSDFTQGSLSMTGNKYDLALEGNGFFQVRTPQGIAYTRNGGFTVDSRGQLVTAQNYQVLGTNGQPIIVGGANKFSVDTNGVVMRDGVRAGQLNIVNLTNPTKVDASLWSGTPAGRSANTIVHQNYLEDSNTDAVRTITDITVSQRAFDAGQRVLRTIDDTLSIAAKIAQVS